MPAANAIHKRGWPGHLSQRSRPIRGQGKIALAPWVFTGTTPHPFGHAGHFIRRPPTGASAPRSGSPYPGDDPVTLCLAMTHKPGLPLRITLPLQTRRRPHTLVQQRLHHIKQFRHVMRPGPEVHVRKTVNQKQLYLPPRQGIRQGDALGEGDLPVAPPGPPYFPVFTRLAKPQ